MEGETEPEPETMPRPKGSRNNSAKLSDEAHEAMRIAASFMGMQHAELTSDIVLDVCNQVIAYKHAQRERGDKSRFDPAAKKFEITVRFPEAEPASE